MRLLLLFFLSLLFVPAATASTVPIAIDRAQTEAGEEGVGISEKLGEYIPLDALFYDERGNLVSLGALLGDNKPVIIVPAYYRCKNLCTTILDATASVIERMRLVPGKDFNVITISFNELETPEEALNKKKTYLKAAGKPLSAGSWRFLTGNNKNIKSLTEAIGMSFVRKGEEFLHPSALVVISGEGRISRYLYGNSYLPFDLEMALTEASKGVSRASIRKALLLCFSYDPEGRRYVFNTLRVTGTLVLTSVLVMAFLLTRNGKKG